MDKLDCQILEALQYDFPLSEEPYEIISRRLRIPCEQLWQRTKKLVDEGIIRRIGASLDSYQFGFSSTLAAISTDSGLVEQASEVINRYPEITHSYLRKDQFNIWFTIIAVDNDRIKCILEQIRSVLSLRDSQVLNLPMKRLFKLDARFNFPS